MANENKKSNELVEGDDDPTVELEALAVGNDGALQTAAAFETDRTDTHQVLVIGKQDDGPALERMAAELDRVKADTKQLEKELDDRDEALALVASRLERAEQDLCERDQALADRDQQIALLDARIDAVEDEASRLRGEASQRGMPAKDARIADTRMEEELAAARHLIERQAGQIAASNAENRQLLSQVERTEAYADQLRHELTDITIDTDAVSAEQTSLVEQLDDARMRLAGLKTELESAMKAEACATETLAQASAEHEQEIEALKSALGEADASSARHAKANERLLSDLRDARSFRDDLARMLGAQQERNQVRLRDCRRQIAEPDGKDGAVQGLLEEIVARGGAESAPDDAQKVARLDTGSPPGDQQEAHAPSAPRPAENGIARLLVGSIDDRELRFPLFKDKLTIGRTRDNDIQLNAPYISRRHAVVCSDGKATRIIDWESRNGVYVNSRRVTEHFLSNGDIVSIGDAEFRYEEKVKRDD